MPEKAHEKISFVIIHQGNVKQTQRRKHFKSTWMVRVKKDGIVSSFGEDVEKLEHLVPAGGSIK